MCLMCRFLKGKMQHKGCVRKKMAVAATIGATVGVVAGLLLASKPGRETREELVKKIKELPDKAKELAKKTHEKLEKVKEKISEETHTMLDEVKEKVTDAEDAMNEGQRFKKPVEITEEEIDSFKKKLK